MTSDLYYYSYASSLGRQPRPQIRVSLMPRMNLRSCWSCYYLPYTYLDMLFRISCAALSTATVRWIQAMLEPARASSSKLSSSYDVLAPISSLTLLYAYFLDWEGQVFEMNALTVFSTALPSSSDSHLADHAWDWSHWRAQLGGIAPHSCHLCTIGACSLDSHCRGGVCQVRLGQLW